jgi:hypothetical protein
MASGTVAIKFRLDGADQFHVLELDAKSAGDALKNIQDNARSLNSELVNFASISQIAEGASSVVQQLTGVFQGLTSAYANQHVAETKLAQAMRNTMDASNEEIESIKQLCSEQQKLGVIGDEVQLAASQELATYLTMSDNLKTLIPVMNDMVAQQYGLGASAESATQIASMLGKVMNGQTEALSRYGYKFDDVQKHILQYGDESERAAVLAQVVTEAVGGMNAELAKTPAGRMQQLGNAIGDLKEKLGKAIQNLMPAMTLLSNVTNIIAGWNRLKVAMDALAKSTLVVKIQSMGLAVASRVQAMAQNLATTSTWAAVFGTRALTAAVAALWAALTMGISLIITGIISLFHSFSDSAEDAAGAIGEVDEAQQAYNNAAGTARGEMAKEIVELEKLIKQHGDETKKIRELNAAYGESFGYHNTAKEWYDILISKSKEYCRQLAYEAKAKAYQDKLGQQMVEVDEAQAKVDAMIKANGGVEPAKETKSTSYTPGAMGGASSYKYTHSTEYGNAVQDLERKKKAADETEAKMKEAISAASDAQKAVEGGNAETDWRKMSYAQLGDEIKKTKESIANNSGTEEGKAEAKRLTTELKQMESRYKKLGKENGLSNDTSGGTTKHKYGGDRLIAEAKSYNELSNNVKYYEKEIEKADASDKEQLANLARGYAEAKKKVDDFNKSKEKIMLEAQKPEEIQSVGDIQSLEQVNKAIEYQQKLRNSATAEELKGIDAEIKRLNDLKTAFEDSTHVELKTEEIKTYRQLEEEISFYSRQLKTASEADRKKIQAHIVDLEDLKKKWDDVLEEMSKPGDISTLKTIEDLDEAISWYGNHQKKVSGQEYLDIQKIINALQQKKDLMEAPAKNEAKIAEMQVETSQLNGLEGKSLKMKLELIGLDGVAQKIREIQQMINDPSATEDQKKALKELRAQYVSYYKDLLKTDKGMIQAWGTIRGLGNSIEGMTEAIKGHGNAWKKITGIIDGAIGIYHSLESIIEIVKMLTGVTKAMTVAKEMEGNQDLITGAQSLVGAGQEVAASESVAEAKGVETTANVAASASALMSAHSGIPFVGWAIGAALVAAMLGLMLSLPKFADGGIAYGPTLGLFGEYSGASHNPEVVAPLDKLKGMLNEPAGFGGKVTFRIEGRNLVGVLGKESHYRSRT